MCSACAVHVQCMCSVCAASSATATPSHSCSLDLRCLDTQGCSLYYIELQRSPAGAWACAPPPTAASSTAASASRRTMRAAARAARRSASRRALRRPLCRRAAAPPPSAWPKAMQWDALGGGRGNGRAINGPMGVMMRRPDPPEVLWRGAGNCDRWSVTADMHRYTVSQCVNDRARVCVLEVVRR